MWPFETEKKEQKPEAEKKNSNYRIIRLDGDPKWYAQKWAAGVLGRATPSWCFIGTVSLPTLSLWLYNHEDFGCQTRKEAEELIERYIHGVKIDDCHPDVLKYNEPYNPKSK